MELEDWHIIGGGVGIHWPLIDEDVPIAESDLSVAASSDTAVTEPKDVSPADKGDGNGRGCTCKSCRMKPFLRP